MTPCQSSTSESSSECSIIAPVGSPISDISTSSEQSFSMESIFGAEISLKSHSWTFKLVGDNIDKTIKPRHMTLDNPTKSLHYFNVYAVNDRVDISHLSDTPQELDVTTFSYRSILPSMADKEALEKNFSFLVIRILRKYIPFFSKFAAGVGHHIQHQYSNILLLCRILQTSR